MTHSALQITPETVHSTLRKHMLVDGFDLVLDLEKSEGSYLADKRTGRRFVDFFTFFASTPIGFNHPRIARDHDFLARLTRASLMKPSNSDIYTEEMAAFVATYSRVGIPGHLPYLFLIDGGTLAVENALKVAFDWKVRLNFEKGYQSEKGHQIIHFRQAFHGRSGYCISLTNTVPDKTAYFPKFDWPRIVNPGLHFPLTDESVAATQQLEEQAILEIKQAIAANKDDIAAIIIEPIQAEGGDVHFRKSFLQSLRQIADESDVLLIFDEVQTGFGLTGKFWAHEHFVEPDILAFGKKSQICGVLAGKRIDTVPANVFHTPSRINSTWGGNLTDMVRSTRYLEIIEEEDLVGHANSAGAYLLHHIQSLALEFEGMVTNPRGLGLMCAFDLPSADLRKQFISRCYDNGLMILVCGPRSIRFRPALNIPLTVIDEGIAIIRQVLSTLR
ncbi:MAG: L-lysine 6-transaminase [Bacteroidetes bacterium]|nr:L-lysine 6-transaminase [Bacteroidota bacterium]